MAIVDAIFGGSRHREYEVSPIAAAIPAIEKMNFRLVIMRLSCPTKIIYDTGRYALTQGGRLLGYWRGLQGWPILPDAGE